MVDGVRFRFLSAVPRDGFRPSSQAEIRIEVEDASAVAVFDGAVLTRELRASGDVWSGRVRVGREPLRVGVKRTQGEPWRVLFAVKVTE